MPFSDFRSDKSFFRATASAVSPDMNVAKKIALQNAKSELAGSIQSLLQEVSTAYIQQHGVNATPDLSQKFESMNQVVVSQMLTNITVAREKFFKSKDTNDYRCFVGIEMAKEDVGKGVIDRISQDTKDRIDFDAAQYRKIFDEKTGK